MAQDRPLHAHQVLDVGGVPPAVRTTVEQAEHRGDDHAADRRRGSGGQAPLTDAGDQRHPDDRRVRRQVGRTEQPTAGLDVGGDEVGQVALVERARAVGGDDLEGGREVGDDHVLVGQPVVLVQGAVALGVPPEDAVVDVVEVVERRRAQPEPAARHVDGRCHQFTPRQVSVARVGLAERRERAVGGDGAWPDGDRDPAAVGGRHVPGPRRGSVVGAIPAGHVDPSVDGVRRAGRRLDGDEAAGAQRDEPDLVDHRHQRRRDRGVDGRATGACDTFGGVGGRGVRCSDGERGHAGLSVGSR